MSDRLTAKTQTVTNFEPVRNGDSTTVERELHREGELSALQGYCEQHGGHTGGRRVCRCVLGKGCLQRNKRRRRRKGTKNTLKRQGEDKQIEKVALLTPKQGKQTDRVSVRGKYEQENDKAIRPKRRPVL